MFFVIEEVVEANPSGSIFSESELIAPAERTDGI